MNKEIEAIKRIAEEKLKKYVPKTINNYLIKTRIEEGTESYYPIVEIEILAKNYENRIGFKFVVPPIVYNVRPVGDDSEERRKFYTEYHSRTIENNIKELMLRLLEAINQEEKLED